MARVGKGGKLIGADQAQKIVRAVEAAGGVPAPKKSGGSRPVRGEAKAKSASAASDSARISRLAKQGGGKIRLDSGEWAFVHRNGKVQRGVESPRAFEKIGDGGRRISALRSAGGQELASAVLGSLGSVRTGLNVPNLAAPESLGEIASGTDGLPNFIGGAQPGVQQPARDFAADVGSSAEDALSRARAIPGMSDEERREALRDLAVDSARPIAQTITRSPVEIQSVLDDDFGAAPQFLSPGDDLRNALISAMAATPAARPIAGGVLGIGGSSAGRAAQTQVSAQAARAAGARAPSSADDALMSMFGGRGTRSALTRPTPAAPAPAPAPAPQPAFGSPEYVELVRRQALAREGARAGSPTARGEAARVGFPSVSARSTTAPATNAAGDPIIINPSRAMMPQAPGTLPVGQVSSRPALNAAGDPIIINPSRAMMPPPRGVTPAMLGDIESAVRRSLGFFG